MVDAQNPAAVTARDRAEQYHMMLGFWLGAVVYGLYTYLFALFVKITIQTRRPGPNVSSQVFTLGALVTFVLTTIYMGCNTSRYLYAFSPDWVDASNGRLPVYYLHDFTKALNSATSDIMGVLVWTGDALVIYRCLIIWEMNWWIVALPGLLFTFSVVNGAVIRVWLKRPGVLTIAQVHSLTNMVYPVNIAQSCLTTGLITFKIWRQYRLSRSVGLNNHGSGVGLLTVIRIIVESTMICTIQQVVLCILYYLNSPAQWAVHGTLVPSMGVVFVLLFIRIHEAKKAPLPTIQLPWSSGESMSTPLTASNGTSEGTSHAPHQQRGHRRTVSDGVIVAAPSISISLPKHIPYSAAPFRSATDDAVDLERGGVASEKSVGGAILPVNALSKYPR